MTTTLERYAPPMDSERWLSRAEAAKFLEVSPQTIDRYVREGRLTRHRFARNNAPRYRIEDLREFLGIKPADEDKGEK
jgi:excisionase family DNA binding protein